MDLTVSAARLPKKGESLAASGFSSGQGGKGANQAAACAKLGCDCSFIGAVGDDLFGQQLLSSLRGYGVNTDAVQVLKGERSGVCVIIVSEEEKDNYLLVELGANLRLSHEDVARALLCGAKEGDLLVLQLEVPMEVVKNAARIAKSRRMTVILNPAPAVPLDRELLENVDLLVPNETEAELLTGVSVTGEAEALAAYRLLAQKGVRELIVTLGARGCVHVNEAGARFYRARRVHTVDPTSAGDTFIGALAARLSEEETLEAGIPYAMKCAAITVTRRGSACSVPTAEEVEKFEYPKEENV